MKRTWFIMVHSSVFNIVLSSQIESLALAPWAPEALSKKKNCSAAPAVPCSQRPSEGVANAAHTTDTTGYTFAAVQC